MKLPPAIEKAAARFNRMTLRERALVSAAALACTIMLWMLAFLDPLSARERMLQAEMQSLQDSIHSVGQTIESPDVAGEALARATALQGTLDDINAQLASKSAGLIPPENMVQVIHDVLTHQRGVSLVSLHNKPVTTLVPETQASPDANHSTLTGPYVHPVELVIEGRYLDVLAYLRALETLQWRFYWKVLELETTEYPINRVRIELSTLSMEREWLSV